MHILRFYTDTIKLLKESIIRDIYLKENKILVVIKRIDNVKQLRIVYNEFFLPTSIYINCQYINMQFQRLKKKYWVMSAFKHELIPKWLAFIINRYKLKGEIVICSKFAWHLQSSTNYYTILIIINSIKHLIV